MCERCKLVCNQNKVTVLPRRLPPCHGLQELQIKQLNNHVLAKPELKPVPQPDQNQTLTDSTDQTRTSR